MKKTLGSFSQYLLDQGHIDGGLKIALETEAKRAAVPFEDVLWKNKVLSEDIIFESLLNHSKLSPALKEPTDPETLAIFNDAIILDVKHKTVQVFTVRPPSSAEEDDLHQTFPDKEILLFLIPLTRFLHLQKIVSSHLKTHWQSHKTILSPNVLEKKNEGFDSTALLNQLIRTAISHEASDIHYHPKKSFVVIKLRVDGLLRTIAHLHQEIWQSLLIHIKVKGNLNIADTKHPQSGAFYYKFGLMSVPLRLSTHPSFYGETVTLRILDMNHRIQKIDHLDLPPDLQESIKTILTSGTGLCLVVGPTGSGKTTTLYTLLETLDHTQKHIVTLEQPIERHVPTFTQTEIGSQHTISFEEGVRSALRQDPDVLLVGETRDEKTAAAVFRASMTGHQTFTTLHASSTEEALDRLTDLGISRSLQNTQISAIIAQRLVPRLCPSCKKQALEFSTHNQKGCSVCHYTGYQGRILMIELLHRPSKTSLEKHGCDFNVQAQKHLQIGNVALKDVKKLIIDSL